MERTKGKKRWRTGILEILLLMGTVAIVVAAYQNTWSMRSYEAQFGAMPFDDRAIEEWYRQKPDVVNLKVNRQDDLLKVEYRTRQGGLFPELAPFEEMGYQPLRSLKMNSRREFPLYRTLGALFLLWLIGWLLRYWQRKRNQARSILSSNPSESPFLKEEAATASPS